MSESWGPGIVETYTGGQFDVLNPDPADVDLRDVAAGLAHTCRFGGHCRYFYSVAQHSIHVSHELSDDPRLQLFGLFHDAGEAYIGDVPRPIKARIDEFERIEAGILDAVWMAFDVEPPTQEEWERVMAADDRLLAYEASALLEDGNWAGESVDLGYDLQADSIETVRDQFITRSERLLK